MKGKKILLSVALVFSLMGISACRKNRIVDVVVQQDIQDIYVGEFPYVSYSITRTYSNGKTDTVPLSEDMFTDDELMKFYIPGDQTVYFKYMGATLSFNVTVLRKTLNVTCEDEEISYDGQMHGLTLKGEIPGNAEISYPNGNAFKDTGTYKIRTIITCEGYETLVLDNTLKINKSDLDLSNVFLDDKTFTYDGEEKKLTLEGTLPDDVNVTYKINGKEGNSAVNAGTYTVEAFFTSTNSNYNSIPSKKATLTIKKADYSVDRVRITNLDREYTGEDIVFEAESVRSIPSWIEITYENNVQKEVGVYVVTIHFNVTNENYNAIDDKTYEVTIYEAK